MRAVMDTEIYCDYFLASFLDVETDVVTHYEITGKDRQERDRLEKAMGCLTIGFNSINFDLPMITAAIAGWPCVDIKRLANSIIEDSVPGWMACKQAGLDVPPWDHIDLIDVAPGKASLKIYGGRLHAPKMQDLPIEPSASIAPDMRKSLRDYCENDLQTTRLLYRELEPVIELRCSMSAQYGVDLRSKSDAQIAETVIKSELEKITGRTYHKPPSKDGAVFRYRDPRIVSFQSRNLQDLFSKILEHDFVVSANGSVKIPDWLRDEKIKIGKSYQLGIGGLHSCEKGQALVADEGHALFDLDVASYYPSIILQQALSPKALGREFLDVYRSIVMRRLAAKEAGDMVTADTLKIAANGSFGKLGSKYSPLYAPELFLQVTMTGQLALLMLIEALHIRGIDVVSANTDGVVIHCPRALERTADLVAWEWMLDTSYALERTDYRGLYSRDVNNYLAVTIDGKTKGKGIFGKPHLMKNPDRRVVQNAVSDFLAHGKPIGESIEECENVRDFVTIRQVKGGALWRGQKLGKAVRFYASSEVSQNESICYAINGNRVPHSGGCRPLMDLPAAMPDDVHRFVYLQEAKKLLKDVGYSGKKD